MATWIRTSEIEKRRVHTYERCVCSRCEKSFWVRLKRHGQLRTSQGCRVCASTVHGHASNCGPTPTWKTWVRMIGRCTRSTEDHFHRYGGRGITVCDRWLGPDGFANFLSDMGERPKDRTLDRKDNDGNYEPSNCRWATRDEQNFNKSNNRWVTANGETLILGEWANRLGMDVKSLHSRIFQFGWPPHLAVTAPKGSHLADLIR